VGSPSFLRLGSKRFSNATGRLYQIHINQPGTFVGLVTVVRARKAPDRPIPTISLLVSLIFPHVGGLVDPQLRASNEHILIVRVPRAQKIIRLHPHPPLTLFPLLC
jgi:hypothetical protein